MDSGKNSAASDSKPPGEGPGEPGGEDPVARAILGLIETLAPGRSISPVEAARAFALDRGRPGDPPDAWRRYLPAVRQQALNLARRGRLAILRKGRPVDPHAPFKGVVRRARAAEPSSVASLDRAQVQEQVPGEGARAAGVHHVVDQPHPIARLDAYLAGRCGLLGIRLAGRPGRRPGAARASPRRRRPNRPRRRVRR